MLRCLSYFSFLLATLSNHVQPQRVTPIIGAKCDLKAADVPVGGKQTQFYLKCEHTAQSENGKGIWMVKSVSTTAPATFQRGPSAAASSSANQEQMSKYHRPDNSICVQDKSARENDSCSVSSLCLQQDQRQMSSYLQCDQSTNRWIKKSCLDGQSFSFEHQNCIVSSATPSRQNRLGNRHHAPPAFGPMAGITCTFMQCSQSNPCQQGTCNNGYCCIFPIGRGLLSQPFATPALHHQQPVIINQQPSFPMQSVFNPALTSVCANGGSPAGACVNMRCARGYVCSPGNVCCPAPFLSPPVASTANPIKNPFVCTDGTQAAGACILGQCGASFTCDNGLCCNKTSNTPRCLDGSPAVGACLLGQCGAGFICTTGNLCCPSKSRTDGSCPNGGTPIGECINGLCPTGYTCINRQCCPGAGNATFRCSNLNYVLGPCVGNLCPDAGFECDTTINSCCPKTDPIGPCIEPGNQCPDTYKCFTEGRTPLCYKVCDGRGTKSSEPVNGVCPGGPNTLIFGDCCNLTTKRFYNPKSSIYPSDGNAEYFRSSSARLLRVGQCPDGSGAVSACINGLCGHGYQCYNNLCCAARSTYPLIPFPQSTLRPIGGSCDFTQQCISSMEGLSVCELGICNCLPGSYFSGSVCVRRFNLLLNDAEMSLSNNTLAYDASGTTVDNIESR